MARSAMRRQAELRPIRVEVADEIDHIGWPKARLVIEEVLGVRTGGLHGGWWSRVGKRNGPVLVQALEDAAVPKGQLRLFRDPEA